MLLIRVVIVLLGFVALIVGVLGLLAAGWMAVAIVVVGVSALGLGLRLLVRHLRDPGSPSSDPDRNGTGNAS
jgi:hypothetical protein